MTAAVVGERPPSPPISNDGDFGLGAVQQHVASLDKHAAPRSLRPAPISISDPEIVSTPHAVAPNDEKRNGSDPLQDQYGDPSMYETAQNYTYYPVQPVGDLINAEMKGDANAATADVRTNDPPPHSSYYRVRCWHTHPKWQSAWFASRPQHSRDDPKTAISETKEGPQSCKGGKGEGSSHRPASQRADKGLYNTRQGHGGMG